MYWQPVAAYKMFTLALHAVLASCFKIFWHLPLHCEAVEVVVKLRLVLQLFVASVTQCLISTRWFLLLRLIPEFITSPCQQLSS
jgi:uncharacterized membrane protein